MAKIRLFDRNLRAGESYLYSQTNQVENFIGLQQNILPKKLTRTKLFFLLDSGIGDFRRLSSFFEIFMANRWSGRNQIKVVE